MRKAVYGMLFTCLLIGLTETLLRVAGFRPYNSPFINITFQPSFNHLPDTLLGYALANGSYTITSRSNTDTLVYHATHHNGRRIADTTQTEPIDSKEEGKIVLLGCSFTYGHGLEDTATMAFILQKKLQQTASKLQVDNLATGGYSPTQFYLLSGIIDSINTKLVIVNYADFQNERTTLCRSWRKLIVPNQNNTGNFSVIRAPYFTNSADSVVLKYRQMTYKFLPLQKHLALVELLDNLYCRYEQKQALKVSRSVLELTLQRLKQQGVEVLLCGISPDEGTKTTLNLFEEKGYNTLFYGVDVWKPQYNLLPKDGHPNYAANQIFADSLFAYLVRNNYVKLN